MCVLSLCRVICDNWTALRKYKLMLMLIQNCITQDGRVCKTWALESDRPAYNPGSVTFECVTLGTLCFTLCVNVCLPCWTKNSLRVELKLTHH